MMNNQPRVIAEGRDESDCCTKLTPGCCIDHEREPRRTPTGEIFEGSCEPW